MASSSSASSSSSNEQQGEAPAYEIKGRTMSLEEWELNIQSESPVDFDSLAAHDCDVGKYYEKQGLGRYFNLLNGPTYQTLFRHFWVRARKYKQGARNAKIHKKVAISEILANSENGTGSFAISEAGGEVIRRTLRYSPLAKKSLLA
ncbi:hypothetical protein MTR_3g031890 [Medicago truncatula]|uniref:Uncharacterized protein n=1 Tax=Medicago truncatula TaxID=3880 RepID=G7IWY1_MEDTR|nr:hypothetical protein MTR_3g031890 [Medicago truncatula]